MRMRHPCGRDSTRSEPTGRSSPAATASFATSFPKSNTSGGTGTAGTWIARRSCSNGSIRSGGEGGRARAAPYELHGADEDRDRQRRSIGEDLRERSDAAVLERTEDPVAPALPTKRVILQRAEYVANIRDEAPLITLPVTIENQDIAPAAWLEALER